ncbi:juvenile hormone esterase-like isoform X1 [Oratosquilla oratoria]|uniref:juvenile hormone esterase-like isoform X1 n=1 Tax=Oratosquilla oratoria TaxID=337810 RepID=UPI003F77108A
MGFAVLANLTLILAVALVSANERIELDIIQGRLFGTQETTLKGRNIFSFRGIPYAKPPVGPLRFKDPEPPDNWEGMRDASSNPPRCLQLVLDLFLQGKIAVDGEEDCLYLNVFTPNFEVNSRLPVMVYVHGGGFISGEAYSYPPNALLERDVVLVVIQYRLGIFGFLSTEDDVIPGNFGLKDQTQALRWIQQNIAFFGGDPTKVTIFGNSSGGTCVHYQMIVPEAKGLFSRVIMQSGSAFASWATDQSHAKVARYIGQAVGCSLNTSSQDYLECMQKIPATALCSQTSETFELEIESTVLVPRIDGNYIINSVEVLISTGQFHKVPLISGVTAGDGSCVTAYIFSNAELKEKIVSNISVVSLSLGLKDRYPREAEKQALKIFNKFIGNINFNDEDAKAITEVYSDFLFHIAHDVTAMLQSRHHPVFLFELQHRGQRSFSNDINVDNVNPTIGRDIRSWISHADELFYLFEGGMFELLDKEEDLALRDKIVALWTNFADTGNPTPDDSLGFIWEPVTESSLHYLALQPEMTMEKDTRTERRSFWLDLPVFQNLVRALQISAKEEL